MGWESAPRKQNLVMETYRETATGSRLSRLITVACGVCSNRN